MRNLFYFISGVAVLLLFYAPLSAGEIKTSADMEVFYERSTDVEGEEDDDQFKTNRLHLQFDGEFEEGLAARVIIDGADVVESDGGDVTEDIVEEANFSIHDIAGAPVYLIFGKDEMPYGLDYDPYLNDSIAHGFEIDKVWGVHAIARLGDIGNVAVALYEHRNGSLENEVTDNYTARLMIDKLFESLVFQVSYANEEYVGTGLDDETRYSAGFIFKFLDGANVNLEYNGFENRGGIVDYDPALLTTGIEFEIEKFKLYARYEKIFEDVEEDVDLEEDYFMGGISYSPADNYTLSLELANFNSKNLEDAGDLNVADDLLETAVIAGVRVKF